MTVFPTLEFLIELMGLAFLDFRPSMLFVPSQVSQVSQVSIKKLEVILLFTCAHQATDFVRMDLIIGDISRCIHLVLNPNGHFQALSHPRLTKLLYFSFREHF